MLSLLPGARTSAARAGFALLESTARFLKATCNLLLFEQ